MRAAGLAKLGHLSELLLPTELRRVADSLAIDGVVRRAVRTLAPEKRAVAEEHVAAVLSAFGSREALATTLRVIASTAERTPSAPTLVWSGPQLPGDSVRTTAAVVRLIDEAEESVLASTYSGSATAPFVQALRRAAQRRLAITVVCDVSQRRDCAEAIRGAVPRARVLGYCDPETGQARMQHSKVLVIDDRAALVTSANLSYAAVELNLEAGVLIEDFALASQITRRFADLLAAGNLRDLA